MSLHENSNSSLYGFGVFTTVAVAGGEPFLWEKHWRRLKNDAVKIGLDISSFAEAEVRDALHNAIKVRGLTFGRARLTIIDGSAAELWPGEGDGKISLSILAAERRPVPESLRLTISPHRINTTSPLAGIKSCNYLEPFLSVKEAKSRGFDESIRLNERGEVASACMANVFWLKEEMLFTPSLRTGCLPGTTREYILEYLECKEVEAGIEAVREADEVFLSSAGLGVVQVNELDGRPLGMQHHGILGLIPRPA